MGALLAVAVVLAVTAAVVAAVNARGRRDAEHRATHAEARMRAAQAEYGALTVKVEELQSRGAAAAEAALAAPTEPPLTDPLTGLPGDAFFTATLDSRVAAARRHLRPVAIVLLEVIEPDGEPADPVLVTTHLARTVREADIACRLDGPSTFGMLLEDTPENGAVWTVERFRRSMATGGGGQVLRAGIACYPAHAFDAGELRGRAEDALRAARQWRQDRIEVATATEA